jgi:hypothetical protein
MAVLHKLTLAQAEAAAEYNKQRFEVEGAASVPYIFQVWAKLPGDLFAWTSTTTAQAISEYQRVIGTTADGKWGPASDRAEGKYLMQLTQGDYIDAIVVDHMPVGSNILHEGMRLAREWRGKPEPTKAEFDAWDYIVQRESGGWVGRPNYTADIIDRYRNGRVNPEARFSNPKNQKAWHLFMDDVRNSRAVSIHGVRSSAVDVGQLLGSNWVTYCPIGRRGIGKAVPALAAMDAYCDGRYSGVLNAAEFYDLDHCPSDRRSYYSERALQIGCKPGEGY